MIYLHKPMEPVYRRHPVDGTVRTQLEWVDRLRQVYARANPAWSSVRVMLAAMEEVSVYPVVQAETRAER